MSHIYCPECGFQNPEAANYCAKCGAMLHAAEPAEQTQTFSADDGGDQLDALEDLRVEGPALVVRSGGGRAAETFAPPTDRPSPDPRTAQSSSITSPCRDGTPWSSSATGTGSSRNRAA